MIRVLLVDDQALVRGGFRMTGRIGADRAEARVLVPTAFDLDEHVHDIAGGRRLRVRAR